MKVINNNNNNNNNTDKISRNKKVLHSEQWGAPCGCTDNYQEKEPELRRNGDYDDDDDNYNNKQGHGVKKS